MPLEEKWLTYNDWNNEYRYVKKGSKASRFDADGIALFSSSQTALIKSNGRWGKCAKTEYDWDDYPAYDGGEGGNYDSW